jgi:NADH-quinone oxidoreductase subunit J
MNLQLGDIVIALPSLGQFVFMNSAGLGILAAVMMVTRKNAVHSALWLILVFFNLAIMYVMLGAEFLAALQVLVYTGAILVLFLFVIMLLGLREGPKLSGLHTAQVWAAWPVGLLLAIELAIIILYSNQPRQAAVGDTLGGNTVIWSTSEVNRVGGNVQALGQTLYTQYLFPFEVASLILLLAVIGAIVLARKEEPTELEEVIPSIGISLARRTGARLPQEEQVEKKLLPALGTKYTPHATGVTTEVPTVEQPSGVGAGTTAGVELKDKR